MTSRKKLNCIICGIEFSTNSSNRKECYTCLPKADISKPFDPCLIEKDQGGISIRRDGAPKFISGATVGVQVSKEERERIIFNRPVVRTRNKKIIERRKLK